MHAGNNQTVGTRQRLAVDFRTTNDKRASDKRFVIGLCDIECLI